MRVSEILSSLYIEGSADIEGGHKVRSPIDGAVIGSVKLASAKEGEAAIDRAHAAFLQWRGVPAPVRGELVRLLGVELRRHKESLWGGW